MSGFIEVGVYKFSLENLLSFYNGCIKLFKTFITLSNFFYLFYLEVYNSYAKFVLLITLLEYIFSLG